jgi:hypothetical protein
MSRHLILRCDAPGCAQQTETHASDSAPTSIDVPEGWLTLIAPGRAHRHYCSEACLHADAASTVVKMPTVEPPSVKPRARKAQP